MIFVFKFHSPWSELHGETFSIESASAFDAGVRASYKVQDTFAPVPAAQRIKARAEFVASYPSRRAFEAAEESGEVEALTRHRHDFRDGDVCSTCDALRGAA